MMQQPTHAKPIYMLHILSGAHTHIGTYKHVNKLVFLARNENLYFEVRLVEFRKRLKMQTHISQLYQLLHELCLAIIAQDISIIAQH